MSPKKTDNASEYLRKRMATYLFEISQHMTVFIGDINNRSLGKHNLFMPGSGCRFDWFRDALRSCFELGLPVTPESALRILEDFEFFKAQLPIPFDAREWGIEQTGTEATLHWWRIADERYRRYHLLTFKIVYALTPFAEIKKRLAVGPSGGASKDFQLRLRYDGEDENLEEMEKCLEIARQVISAPK